MSRETNVGTGPEAEAPEAPEGELPSGTTSPFPWIIQGAGRFLDSGFLPYPRSSPEPSQLPEVIPAGKTHPKRRGNVLGAATVVSRRGELPDPAAERSPGSVGPPVFPHIYGFMELPVPSTGNSRSEGIPVPGWDWGGSAPAGGRGCVHCSECPRDGVFLGEPLGNGVGMPGWRKREKLPKCSFSHFSIKKKKREEPELINTAGERGEVSRPLSVVGEFFFSPLFKIHGIHGKKKKPQILFKLTRKYVGKNSLKKY